jgi:putative ABC transport system permease protein
MVPAASASGDQSCETEDRRGCGGDRDSRSRPAAPLGCQVGRGLSGGFADVGGVGHDLVEQGRAATRRPGRFIATTFGLTIGIALVIAGLALRTGVQTIHREGMSRIALDAHDPDLISLAATTANLDRTSTLGFTIAAFLIGLALINAIIAAVFSAHDSARNHAILRTVGATPGQTVTAFLMAQLAACLLACAIGIPFGITLYDAIRGATLDPIGLTALAYLATILSALVLYALIALTPARRPITAQLAYE